MIKFLNPSYIFFLTGKILNFIKTFVIPITIIRVDDCVVSEIRTKEKNGYLKTYKRYYWWNDIHFNKEGNKVMADKLIRVIK